MDKYEQPPHTIHHQPSWDENQANKYKTTVLYSPFRQPIFANKKLPEKMTEMVHPNFPGLKFP